MKKCVYIITQTFFNERDKGRFGADYFLSKGYKVVVLDVTKYFYKNLVVTYEQYNAEDKLVIHSCNNYKSINAVIRKEGGGIAFLSVGEGYKSLRIKNLLLKNKIKFGKVESGFIPTEIQNNNSDRNIVKKLFIGIKKYGLFRTIDIIFDKLCSYICLVRADDFLFTTNKDISLDRLGSNFPNNVYLINSRDYDVYLDSKEKPKLNYDKYVVFIDQNIFGCNDFLRMGIDLGLNRTTYYGGLNAYFSQVEKEHNCNVVIAAHPKSVLSEVRNDYGGREVFINQTALLIRDCNFVINYYSTAISFAVLNRIPIVFITSNDLDNTIVQYHTNIFSKSLGNSIANISNDLIKYDLNINHERYSEYEVKYIKSIDTEYRTLDVIYSKLSELGFLE